MFDRCLKLHEKNFGFELREVSIYVNLDLFVKKGSSKLHKTFI